MKTYNVRVNGKPFVVEIEEAGSASAPSAPVAAPVPVAAAPSPASSPAPVAAPAPAGAATIASPMPGTVLSVKVSEGMQIKKGEVLLILEAMKMENEIVAPADGTISRVAVAQGSSVNAGDVLIVM